VLDFSHAKKAKKEAHVRHKEACAEEETDLKESFGEDKSHNTRQDRQQEEDARQ
jgi:hypothetical protein